MEYTCERGRRRRWSAAAAVAGRARSSAAPLQAPRSGSAASSEAGRPRATAAAAARVTALKGRKGLTGLTASRGSGSIANVLAGSESTRTGRSAGPHSAGGGGGRFFSGTLTVAASICMQTLFKIYRCLFEEFSQRIRIKIIHCSRNEGEKKCKCKQKSQRYRRALCVSHLHDRLVRCERLSGDDPQRLLEFPFG